MITKSESFAILPQPAPHNILEFDPSNFSNTKPLRIVSSGGNGHISAMQALIARSSADSHTLHDPVPYEKKPLSATSVSIGVAAQLNRIGLFREKLHTLSGFALPDATELNAAIEQLKSKNNQPRPYVDMLLDVYPIGYESTAIWNILQRQDKHEQLSKLIKFQSKNDADHYPTTYDYFLTMLMQAHDAGTPYTSVISTQAVGIPALCDAVSKYNEHRRTENLEEIGIHQFMTDLPSEGAIHFLNTLSRLSPEQQKLVSLYGVNMKKEVLDHFFGETSYLQGIYSIDPKHNPMVRPGFLQPENDNSKNFDKDVELTLKNGERTTIAAGQEVASIMLGSQAGDDTVRYITTLLHNGLDHVYVFGGSHPDIKTKVDEILKFPQFSGKITLLNNQDDPFIAGLTTRSRVVIIRGGGLSVMEQMAMNHPENQIILVHHSDSGSSETKSGIPWEGCNTDSLLERLNEEGIHALKTSPNQIDEQLNSLLQIPQANIETEHKNGWTLT
jgi:effector protein SdbA